MTILDPRAEYVRRVSERQARADQFAVRYHTLFRVRTGTLGVIVAVAWLAEKERLLPLLLSVPAVVFIMAVLAKNRAHRAWQQALRAVRFYERRPILEECWAGTGEPGSRFLDDAHPCARDLDLFGPGSLFERLHLAGTPLGEATLAAWLCTPASPAVVRARQAAVTELRDRLDFREAVALLGQQVPGRLAIPPLTAWAAAPCAEGLRLGRLAGAAVATFTALGFLGWLVGFGPEGFLTALALTGAVALWLHGRVRQLLTTMPAEGADLRPLVPLLARLENECFAASLPGRAQVMLGSLPFTQLVRFLEALPLAPLACLILGTTQLALAVEAWRARHGPGLARWLAALGEMEALNALAAYAYENPADPFPEVIDQGPYFEAEGLGHPLLPATHCVRNDLRLNADQRLLIVSGSNMSGKSTLLRTVGTNAVLALGGAPVRATRLRLGPLTPGATLRLDDSLLQGRSRFFAEVTRIRQLLDLARTHPPLLFLLDELFSGTNSDDRRQGAEVVVRRLLDAGGFGLLTTHDLALTRLADLLAPYAVNVHFADQLKGGVMTFDYRMRPGVVPSGNGLALLRAVGIEV
jgi:hypothetical protein